MDNLGSIQDIMLRTMQDLDAVINRTNEVNDTYVQSTICDMAHYAYVQCVKMHETLWEYRLAMEYLAHTEVFDFANV